MSILLAEKLAKCYHLNFYDGKLYSYHLDNVANNFDNFCMDNFGTNTASYPIIYEKGMIMCYLHDILEDTNIDDENIIDLFGHEMYKNLCYLNRKYINKTYQEYIVYLFENTEINDIVKIVKYCDLIANYRYSKNPSPLFPRNEKWHNPLLKRYSKALDVAEKYLSSKKYKLLSRD